MRFLGWTSSLEAQDNVTQNLIFVLGGCHVVFDDLQGDLLIENEACPHHEGSTTCNVTALS